MYTAWPAVGRGTDREGRLFPLGLLHLDPEAVVTERLLAYIVEAGCLARIGSWKDRTTVVLNQADDERRQQVGKRILSGLSRPGIVTTYSVEMREAK